MGDLQAPIINWQVKAGDSDAGFAEQNILIIGQGSGTNPAKTLIADVQQSEVKTLCGDGSMTELAFNRFREHNRANEVDIITLSEPAGATAAQGGVKVAGDAKENATLKLRVGDDAFKVSVTILKNDTADAQATKIADAINAKNYPFTASIDGADNTLVLITFNVKGELANGLISTVENRVQGSTYTAVPFTGGAGAYDVDGILDGITKRYQTVIFDACMDFDKVEAWLESRFNMSNTVKGGSGFVMKTGALTDVKTFCKNKNSKSMTVFGNVDGMKFNALPLLAMAEFGAKRALRLTDGAVLGDLVTEAQEAFGGINKSSLPYHNTPMSYKQPTSQLTIEQVTDLNDEGVSLFVPATIGTVLGTVKTLYKFDNTGTADETFRFLNAVDTSMAIQEYLFNSSQKAFGQTRATGGDIVAGVAMENALSVKAYIVGLYEDLVGFALAQGGSEAIKSFKKQLTVSLNSATGTFKVYAPVAIVSQFRGLNGVVAISYEFK